MRPSPAFPIAALIVAVGLAAWGFSSMIGQRFSTGEVFPPYSSLRSDPLGARALYESLDRLSGVTAERNYRPLHKLDGAPGSTLLLLHVESEEVTSPSGLDAEAVRKFAIQGGRVVITIDGQESDWEALAAQAEKRRKENARQRREEARQREKSGKKQAAKKDSPPPEKPAGTKDDADKKEKDAKKTEGNEDGPRRPARSLASLLDIAVEQRKFVMTPKGAPRPDPAPALGLKKEDLPPWHSKTFLKPGVTKAPEEEEDDEKDVVADEADTAAGDQGGLEKEGKAPDEGGTEKWTVLATLGGDPVVAMRRYGQGSVILMTDSYFTSNEALFKEPSAAFLAAMAGSSVKRVIFDETHLGTQEAPGIMTLSRRLHLHGLFAGGLILFGLFIWQSSTSLVPPGDAREAASPAAVSGHGSTSALVSLLRRGIPRRQLLAKCFEAWEKSARSTGTPAARISSAESIISAVEGTRLARGQVPALYRQLCAAAHAPPRSTKVGGKA